ncbi:hypothetical protein DESC_780007 [Desulfosarcina cetonica]|nr:hypothetical protein DESC_780007 [Desulfosarcina cetonica]
MAIEATLRKNRHLLSCRARASDGHDTTVGKLMRGAADVKSAPFFALYLFFLRLILTEMEGV